MQQALTPKMHHGPMPWTRNCETNNDFPAIASLKLNIADRTPRYRHGRQHLTTASDMVDMISNQPSSESTQHA